MEKESQFLRQPIGRMERIKKSSLSFILPMQEQFPDVYRKIDCLGMFND
jgi:hypothetical protein